jgi:hypothetical protein
MLPTRDRISIADDLTTDGTMDGWMAAFFVFFIAVAAALCIVFSGGLEHALVSADRARFAAALIVVRARREQVYCRWPLGINFSSVACSISR